MKTNEAVQLLAALAQETRLDIVRLLIQQGPEGLPAGQIAERLGVANATLSFHLKELSHAAVLESTQQGRFVYYRANYQAMDALVGFLMENCCQASADGGSSANCCEP